MNKNTTLDHAKQFYAQGISICAGKADGSKKPVGSWGKYRQVRCTLGQIKRWFGGDRLYAILLVCGSISRNLLVIDFDEKSLIRPFLEKLKTEHPELYKVLVAVRTGSGKLHLYVFCEEPFGKRQCFVKLADNKYAIEFRADGCYVVGAGSPDTTHNSGKPYRVIRGDIGRIPTISPQDVAALVEIATAFEKTSDPKPSKPSLSAVHAFGAVRGDEAPLDPSRPGDDFDQHADWSELMVDLLDYTLVKTDTDGCRYWQRPGGESEYSCKTGLRSANGRDLLYVFSTNTGVFEPDQSYTKFGALAAINHGGDFSAAADELRSLGYGNQNDAVHDDLVVESTRLSQIKFRPVRWQWDQRVPLGYITNLTGDPGAGKGHLMASMTAHVTTGTDWPDGAPCKHGDVLVISDEDGYDDVIGPRCHRHGADLDRVHVFRIKTKDGVEVHLNIAKHIELLRSLLSDRPETRLIFFDPLSAYLGGIDSNSNADVRGLLHTLGKLALERDLAVVGIGHFGKGEKRAVTRTLGSIAFTAKARVEWQAGVHPDDENEPDDQKRRLLLPAKNNLGSAPGLSYRISGPRNGSVLTWDADPVFESASLLARKPTTDRKIDKACDLIEKMLQDNEGQVVVETVREAAAKIGISDETLRRARRMVRPQTKKIDGSYYWTSE